MPAHGDTEDPDMLFNQGTYLLRDNKCDQAIDKFKSACEARPDFADAHHQWGIALMKMGRALDAIEQLKLAASLNPESAASLLSLGGAYQESGDVREAISTYGAFVDRFPQDRDIAKIRKLLAILQREGAHEEIPKPAIAASSQTSVRPINITEPNVESLTTAQDSSNDDYYESITRQGVMRWPAKRQSR